MPRRAKTGLQPLHFLGIAGFIGVIALIGYWVVNHKSDTGFTGADLNVADFMQNSNALSNNTYRFEGVIDGRIDDNWRSSEGRFFSVLVEENGRASPVPVLVPSKFNGTNIQRGERFRFKATVQAETGILVAQELAKT